MCFSTTFTLDIKLFKQEKVMPTTITVKALNLRCLIKQTFFFWSLRETPILVLPKRWLSSKIHFHLIFLPRTGCFQNDQWSPSQPSRMDRVWKTPCEELLQRSTEVAPMSSACQLVRTWSQGQPETREAMECS